MNKHYGQIVEYVVRKAGYNAADLALKTNSNKRNIYHLFQAKNLRTDIIYNIGCIIKHDFSQEFPELFQNKKSEEDYTKHKKSLIIDNNQRANIFIIDDTELDIVIFKMTLKKVLKDSQVNVFYNGESAISKLLEISINEPGFLPDHIFLDLNMPVMDGWDFLEEFHRLNIDPLHKVKIHILSSSIFYSEIKRSLSNPLVGDFISKPVELEKIKTIFEMDP
ncbi:MAG: hypothetical protein JWP67_3386 [Mucilaginibacter sp.]|nr:hypothetical protein [Mucilaginibacter sp.]